MTNEAFYALFPASTIGEGRLKTPLLPCCAFWHLIELHYESDWSLETARVRKQTTLEGPRKRLFLGPVGGPFNRF